MDSQPPVEPDANYGGVTLSQLEEFLAVRKGRSARRSPLIEERNTDRNFSIVKYGTYVNLLRGIRMQ